MADQSSTTRVALIGAGYIAAIHADLLRRRKNVRIVAIVDAAIARAEQLARACGGARAFATAYEAVKIGGIDVAHVMVPPDQHVSVTRTVLEHGVHAFVEKPLALTQAAAIELGALAQEKGLVLGTNHTLVFHPRVLQLERLMASGKLGRLEQLQLVHHVPLRQLDTGDTAHFMFGSEAAILHEQGVHPFALVEHFLGATRKASAMASEPELLASGRKFRRNWSIGLECARGNAQVLLAFGRKMLETTLVAIFTDAVVRIDLERSTLQKISKTRWLDFWDRAQNAIVGGHRLARQGLAGALGYPLALAKVVGPQEPFLKAMGASIASFHEAARGQHPVVCGAEAAANVLRTCDLVAESAGASFVRQPAFVPPQALAPRPGEIVITGGTGFVGKALVPMLLEQGQPVTLLVRRPGELALQFRDPRIRIVVGDATDPVAVDRAVQGAGYVVHMATCAGTTPKAMEQEMTRGIEAVSKACLAHKVERLVFLSSTAALWLGGKFEAGGTALADTQPFQRPAYARGKIAAERALRETVRLTGLDAVVLRPAIVVGKGGIAEHSGVGLWVRDNTAIGWGMGNHALPFVLVTDVARGILAALFTKGISGRCYNLAGDVRISAREYMAVLSKRTGRAYRFHGQPLWVTWLIEGAKWLVKQAVRKPGDVTTFHDLSSRAFLAWVSSEDAKRDLAWWPCADRQRFVAEGIDVHAAAQR